MNILKAALAYAAWGYPVLFLAGKAPLHDGVYSASTDPDLLRRRVRPNANLAIALVDALVIDVDPRHGGHVSHLALKAADCGPIAITGGRGLHFWFRAPARAPHLHLRTRPAPGIDILTSAGKYIVVPPSRTQQPYVWFRPLVPPEKLPDLPAALLAQITGRSRTRGGRRPASKLLRRLAIAGAEQSRNPRSESELQRLQRALATIDPWAGDYHWWVRMLAAIHSAFPGDEGLALAEAWGDGQPGEIAAKWNSFARRSDGVTVATVYYFARHTCPTFPGTRQGRT